MHNAGIVGGRFSALEPFRRQLAAATRAHYDAQPHGVPPQTPMDMVLLNDLLLQREALPETWSRCAEPGVLFAILHENGPDTITRDLDRYADFADELSACARGQPPTTQPEVLGRAARVHLHARSVTAALRLPRRLGATAGNKFGYMP